MTVTLTVAWALFILAPGLAAFAGLFLIKGGDVVHPAPPAPASLISLAIVVFAALGLHALASVAFWLNDVIAPATGWRVGFDPNVYRYFLGEREPDLLGVETAMLMVLLIALSLVGFGVANWVSRTAAPGSTRHIFLYGWLSPLLGQLRPDAGTNKHLLAWVVTNLEVDDHAIGYQGQIDTLSLTADKQVAWIILRNCQMFAIAAKGTGDARTIQRKVIARDIPIPQMQIEGAAIANLAYAVVAVAKTVADAPAKPTP